MSDAVETIVESFILATFALRFSGLYPYSYHARRNRFVLSWPLLLSTVIQLLVFVYVNLLLMLDDWRNYAQPVASSSSLAVVGNLVLRILGLMSTLMVLLPALLGSHRLVKDINRQLRFVNDFIDLSFDTHRLYRQMRILSLSSFVGLLIWVSLNCWHAVHFYELLTQRQATFPYYLVVLLSDYYRMMFLFFLRIQLISLYFMSQQINGFMLDMMNMEHWRYQRRCGSAIAAKDNGNSKGHI